MWLTARGPERSAAALPILSATPCATAVHPCVQTPDAHGLPEACMHALGSKVLGPTAPAAGKAARGGIVTGRRWWRCSGRGAAGAPEQSRAYGGGRSSLRERVQAGVAAGVGGGPAPLAPQVGPPPVRSRPAVGGVGTAAPRLPGCSPEERSSVVAFLERNCTVRLPGASCAWSHSMHICLYATSPAAQLPRSKFAASTNLICVPIP